MRFYLLLFLLLATFHLYAQESTKPLTKRVIVKTNVLSFIAQRPTLTVEKFFNNTFSAEVAFVQGEVNYFLFTDHYNYSGFLVRAKKHLVAIEPGMFHPYAAVYAGNLKRTIQTVGQVDNTGWFGYPSRDFSANSIRGGGSLGVAYLSKNRIVVDALASLGYGGYTTVYKSDANRKATGYLDTQVWLSIGYCF